MPFTALLTVFSGVCSFGRFCSTSHMWRDSKLPNRPAVHNSSVFIMRIQKPQKATFENLAIDRNDKIKLYCSKSYPVNNTTSREDFL